LSAPALTYTEAFTARAGILNQEDFMRDFPGKPPFLLTANFAVRREVFQQLGGFDNSIAMGEDADFSWRMTNAGMRFRLVPTAKARWTSCVIRRISGAALLER